MLDIFSVMINIWFISDMLQYLHPQHGPTRHFG